MGAVTKEVSEDLMKDGIKALVDKLGYANAARFVAMLGGEGDSVQTLREIREKGSIDDMVNRIRKKKAAQL